MGFFSNIFRKKSLSPVNGGGGWRILEPFMGAWQRNMELNREDLLSFHAVFACISIISKDIGKLPLELRKKENGVWNNTAVTISLKELFEFGKEDLLVFVLISYGDYFRLKSNKGRVLEVGWLKDGIVYEEEIEGSEKVDEDSSW